MFDSVRVLSFTPGRVRLKVPNLGKLDELATDIYERITALPSVDKVEMNRNTGSVLIQYDKHLFADQSLVDALQQSLSAQLSPLELMPLRHFMESEESVSTLRQNLSQQLSSHELDRLHNMLLSLVND